MIQSKEISMSPKAKHSYGYDGHSPEDFRKALAQSNIAVHATVPQTIPLFDGIYVNPKAQNTYYEYSSGDIDGAHYEQFLAFYSENLTQGLSGWPVVVFSLELPQPTVPLYIESRTVLTARSILGIRSLPVLSGIEKVTLEGDFSEFFTVYSRDQHALDAFATIAPDLMVDILEHGYTYDIEFAHNRVYFYRLIPLTIVKELHGLPIDILPYTVQDYIDMRDFGIRYGRQFIRAVKASGGGHIDDARPMWKLAEDNHRKNNRRQIIRYITVSLCVAALILLAFITAPILLLWVGFRLSRWRARKKRLIANWHKSRGAYLR